MDKVVLSRQVVSNSKLEVNSMADRVKCLRCDKLILEATARFNDGLCGHCKRAKDKADFDAVVQGWIDNPETLPGTHGIPEPDSISLQIAAAYVRSRLHPTADDMMESACHKVFDKAHEKWTKFGSAALTEIDRVTLAVETFYGEVTNGGLLQYLGNESGAFAQWASESFEAIGIPAYARVMEDVKSLFPCGVIPEDADERWQKVEAIDDERLEAVEQPFWDRYFTDKKEIRRKLFEYQTR